MFKTPRTDEVDKFITKLHKPDEEVVDIEWVHASFAKQLEIEARQWKDTAFKYSNNADYWRSKYRELELLKEEEKELAEYERLKKKFQK
jgi:8-oxo-dGTP pyrophosphatase MutT (NUDIX family)